MIVVVGRERDELAGALVRALGPARARVLTPRDLSRRGWRHDPASPGHGHAVVDGEMVPESEIQAVATTLEAVSTYDLPHIVRDDRIYVAAEMRAFLLVWLSTIPCAVLNRPTPMSLAGCGWRAEQWILTAAALGIPTVTLTEPKQNDVRDSAATFTVTRVGDQVLDAPDHRTARWVSQLAAAAQTTTLEARFSDESPPRLVSVTVIPDLTRSAVAAAAIAWLEGATA